MNVFVVLGGERWGMSWYTVAYYSAALLTAYLFARDILRCRRVSALTGAVGLLALTWGSWLLRVMEYADGGYTRGGYRIPVHYLLDVADDTQREKVDAYIRDELLNEELPLLPAFHPVIRPVDEEQRQELLDTLKREAANA